MAGPKGNLHGFQRGTPCQGIDVASRIVFQRAGVKILLFQDILKIGLRIEQVDHCFLKTMALPCTDIAGIAAVRTGIMKIEVVCRITAFF